MFFDKKQGVDKQSYVNLQEGIEYELYKHKQTCKFYLFYKLETSPLYGKVLFDDVVDSLRDVSDENIEGLVELMKWNSDKVQNNIDTMIECFIKKGSNSIDLFEAYIIEYLEEKKYEYMKKIKLMENQETEENLEKNG